MFLPPGAAPVGCITNAGCVCVNEVLPLDHTSGGWSWITRDHRVAQHSQPPCSSPPIDRMSVHRAQRRLVWIFFQFSDSFGIFVQERTNAIRAVSVSGECGNYCLLEFDIVCSGKQVATFRVYLSRLNTAPLWGSTCSTHYCFEIQNFSIWSFENRVSVAQSV
jgi:hypothetical protein